MLVLVLNCGSSSIKAAVLEAKSGERLARVHVERIGTAGATLRHESGEPAPLRAPDHAAALEAALPALLGDLPAGAKLGAVGHRVVHGGPRFSAPVRIDDEVEATIRELIPLAPLHNPANLAGIIAARKLLPELVHVAVFDTAFHATLPNRAKHYALDRALAERHGLRRFGFHGTSHAYVTRLAASHLGATPRDLRLITCHLGNGASVTAVEWGRSVETSMGLTPLEGLVMGTRSGDVDPGALLHLMRAERLGADELDVLLNEKSGLKGLSGAGNDMRDIEERAAAGDDACRLAIHVYCHRVRKYIGAYAAVMGGVDAIVFTAGVGENSATVRQHVARNLDFLGAQLDDDANRAAKTSRQKPVVRISEETSRTHLLVVASDEEHAIAEEAAAIARDLDRVAAPKPIPVAISARHIHLTQATVEQLFGEGHQLTPRSDLSQPGQFACQETLTIVGPKRSIEGVRVLGPVRRANQVEISRTDEFFLGLDAPIRDSGDTKGTPGITLVGPKGTVNIPDGVICARRHIHMHPDDADAYGVSDGDVVEVAIDSAGRDLTFGDVLIRVSDKFRLEMHVDTDEANAAELNPGDEGMLATTEGRARLVRRSVLPPGAN